MTFDETIRPLLPLVTPHPAVADVAFDRIANLVRTVIGVPVALVSLVDQNQQVFPGAVGLPEPWQTDRLTPLSHSFCQYVVARREPLIVEDARGHPELATNLAIPDLGVVAYAGMPLHDGAGRVVGSLCAIDIEPRRWTRSELDLLADLARTCSAELQLRDAAQRAEHEAARVSLLLELSEALSNSTGVEQVGQLVSQLACKQLGAMSGNVTILDEHVAQLRRPGDAAFPATSEIHRASLFDAGPAAAAAVRAGTALFLHSVDDLAEVSPDAAATALTGGAASFAFLPLQLGDVVFGIVSLTWATAQPFTHDDRELLGGFARYAAGALDRALLLADRRDVAATLQQAMLPTLPALDWLELHGIYRPASVTDAVGGDWFDAFAVVPTPPADAKAASSAGTDGPVQRLALVVGDVTGHDTAAAAIMGGLRAGLRYLALDTPCAPGALLQRLDQVMTSHTDAPVRRMATAVAAHVDKSDPTADDVNDGAVADFWWSNAGHLPPLLLAPGQAPRYLRTPVDLLLGLDSTVTRHSHVAHLPAGSTVLLFTDGLIERRDADIDDGLAALARAADEYRDLALPEFLAAVVAAVLADGHDDDTVLLGMRLPGRDAERPAARREAADATGAAGYRTGSR